jgi:hypothetical protein
MDIQTNEHECIDIRCLRIPTRRQKVRKIKKGREKKLLEIYRERDRLWELGRKRALVAIDPPYQSGWRRSFELRQDVAASKHADFFAEILRNLNYVQKSHRKDFKRKGKKRGRRVYKSTPQNLRRLYPDEWNKLTTRQQQMFHEVWLVDKNKKGRLYKKYQFNEPWRFVLKVRPNMITHAFAIDPDLKSACAQLNGMIERRWLQPAMEHLLNGSVYKFWKQESKYDPRCKHRKNRIQYLEIIRKEME